VQTRETIARVIQEELSFVYGLLVILQNQVDTLERSHYKLSIDTEQREYDLIGILKDIGDAWAEIPILRSRIEELETWKRLRG